VVIVYCSTGRYHHLNADVNSRATSASDLFACHVCSKSFSSTTRCLQHQSYHFCVASGRSTQCFRVLVTCKKYSCCECDQKFFSVSARARHQKRHLFSSYKSGLACRTWAKCVKTVDRRRGAHLACRECGKRFRYRLCLVAHLQCHGFTTSPTKVWRNSTSNGMMQFTPFVKNLADPVMNWVQIV